MNIIKTEIADFCEDGTTVSVTAKSGEQQETFHVQTVDGKYRGGLGCWIMADLSDGDIDPVDYPGFSLCSIVYHAEEYIWKKITQEQTSYKIGNDWVYLLIDGIEGTVKMVTRNDNFINSDASSYQREFGEVIATFETRGEALEHLSTLDD